MSSFKQAERSGEHLLIAIWGDSGTGKTRSGLPVARGLAAEPGEDFKDPATLRRIDARIFVIDTDTGRARHYAPPPGEDPRADRFAFQHADFKPPYTTATLLELCAEAVAAGARVILVDSISMLWDGEGGCSDWQQRLVEETVVRARKRYDSRGSNRYPFDEDYEREKAGMTAWKAPKVDWRRMERKLLALGVHLIVCGHADDKLRIEKELDSEGIETKKTKVVQPKEKPVHERWEPIAEKKFKRRLTVSLILTPEQPGIPFIHKQMDSELAACIPLDRQLNAGVGLKLAAWARGGGMAASKAARSGPLLTDETPERRGPPDADASTPDTGGTATTPPVSDPSSLNDEGPSDTFPADLVQYVGETYDPARPRKLQAPISILEMEIHEVKAWAIAMSDLIKRSPDQKKRVWLDQNTENMVRLRTRGQAWASGLEALVPDSAAISAAADGGASGGESSDTGDGRRAASNSRQEF